MPSVSNEHNTVGGNRLAVVIPAYNAEASIRSVVLSMPVQVEWIIRKHVIPLRANPIWE
jgi:hypothetical protein